MKKIIYFIFVFLCFFEHVWSNEEERIKRLEKQIDLLNRKVDILSQEIDAKKWGAKSDSKTAESGIGQYGMAPGASNVYEQFSGISIGGYGEFLYKNYKKRDQNGNKAEPKDQTDALRTVLYFGYKFDDKILLNTEIEIEHANAAFLEFSYIDYLYSDYLNFRGGVLLSPMGFINHLHEPPIYLGVSRPVTERYIIPSTWREIGAGIFGQISNFHYKAYALNSLKASSFNAKTALRSGRQKASKAVAEDIALTTSLEYKAHGMILGGSYFGGKTGQEQDFDAQVDIYDLHFDWQWNGFSLRMLHAMARVANVKEINDINSYTGDESIGEEMTGSYFELGYDILEEFNTEKKLIFYSRYEEIDTQAKVPKGFEKNPANKQVISTYGFSFKPIVNIAIKLDYEKVRNDAKTGVSLYNLSLSYFF